MPSSAFIGTEARQIYGSSFRVQKGKALGARDPRPGRTTYFVGLLTVPERTTVALRLGENRSLQRRGDEEKGRSSSGFQIKRGRKRTLHRRLLPPAIPKKIASARVQRRPSFLRAGYSPVQPFRTTLDGIRRLSGRSQALSVSWSTIRDGMFCTRSLTPRTAVSSSVIDGTNW